MWRIIANWYSSSENSIRLPSTVSSSFSVSRGVRQGSVLSPLLFLMVMDSLLRDFRWSNIGLSVSGSFVGGAAHADDIRTVASSSSVLQIQANIINQFTTTNSLKLNTSKTEVVRFSKSTFLEGSVILNDESIDFVPEAKCLGVWWNHNLSAHKSVNENICKARRAFFAFGKMHAFHGHLNPLSAISIYKTCATGLTLWQ